MKNIATRVFNRTKNMIAKRREYVVGKPYYYSSLTELNILCNERVLSNV